MGPEKRSLKMRMQNIIRIFLTHAKMSTYNQNECRIRMWMNQEGWLFIHNDLYLEYYLHILPASETIKVVNKTTHISLGKLTFLQTLPINDDLGIKSIDCPNSCMATGEGMQTKMLTYQHCKLMLVQTPWQIKEMESRAGRIDPIEVWRLGEGMRTKMSIKKYVSKGGGGMDGPETKLGSTTLWETHSQLAWQYNTIPFVIFVNVYDVTTMIRRRHVTNKGIRS